MQYNDKKKMGSFPFLLLLDKYSYSKVFRIGAFRYAKQHNKLTKLDILCRA